MKQLIDRNQISRLLYRVVSILLVMAVLVALVPQRVVVAAEPCKFKHKVQSGESLIGIGQMYNYDWRLIAERNDLKEPYVLTVGMVLCIPGGNKPAGPTSTTTDTTTGTKTTQPVLTVAAGINSVYIKVENFPKYIVYYVNVAAYPDQFIDYRIGRFRTNKTGFYENWLRVPAVVPEARFMRLCLKNAWTDALSCVDYENPFFNIIPTVLNCTKNAR
ncbi:MAG: LysM peptidoglycan-binding domain-containing protein [Anaerolineales bacterium]|nr:LysM peptidoglycan-binding domain-containing protein [Anaerolineales bacterium]